MPEVSTLKIHLARHRAGDSLLAAGKRNQVHLDAVLFGQRQHADGSRMGQAAGTDVQLALLALGDDVVDGHHLAFRADEEAAGVGIHPAPVDVVVDVEGRLLHHPIQHLRAHVAEDQAVGIGLELTHVDFVADPSGRARVETRLEVRVEILLPDRGEGTQVAIGAAALAGRHDDIDVAFREIGGKGRRNHTAPGAGDRDGRPQLQEGTARKAGYG